MEFLPAEFIKQRKLGARVSKVDLESFIAGFVKGDIPDYQVAAWLMAVYFQPLSTEETAWLTQAMVNSGKHLKFTGGEGLSVDKHSTGGVGDKASLILGPIVAATGLRVPMMAGRGLGHTGGTLDKLEAISGFDVRLPIERFQGQIENIGISIIGQTEEICPADRRMYSLRDVTSTVDSLPLICASIMSKKIAEGCQSLVLDVKFGSGAFMKSIAAAETLGAALVKLGHSAGVKTCAVLTSMNEPLGRFVGNALEVQECLEILRREKIVREGKSTFDTEVLSLELAAQMIYIAKRCATIEEARELAKATLESGRAYEKFNQLVEAQGGNLSKPMARAQCEKILTAPRDGYATFTDVEKIGLGCIVLGAGRKKSSDTVDFGAGLEVLVKDGQKIKRGDALFNVLAADKAKISAAEPYFQGAVEIRDQESSPSPLVAKVLQ